ncbi:hypothetical protein KEM56_003210 [Ascosphaera pollenicola]|nr:hypothetical protein KEM56_003210 [Ascosphaera pollenicola]
MWYYNDWIRGVPTHWYYKRTLSLRRAPGAALSPPRDKVTAYHGQRNSKKHSTRPNKELAKQLWDYYMAGQQFSWRFSSHTVALIGQILKRDTTRAVPTPTPTDRQLRSSSATRDRWPPAWGIDRAVISRAIKDLHAAATPGRQESAMKQLPLLLEMKHWIYPPVGPNRLRIGHPMGPPIIQEQREPPEQLAFETSDAGETQTEEEQPENDQEATPRPTRPLLPESQDQTDQSTPTALPQTDEAPLTARRVHQTAPSPQKAVALPSGASTRDQEPPSARTAPPEPQREVASRLSDTTTRGENTPAEGTARFGTEPRLPEQPSQGQEAPPAAMRLPEAPQRQDAVPLATTNTQDQETPRAGTQEPAREEPTRPAERTTPDIPTPVQRHEAGILSPGATDRPSSQPVTSYEFGSTPHPTTTPGTFSEDFEHGRTTDKLESERCGQSHMAARKVFAGAVTVVRGAAKLPYRAWTEWQRLISSSRAERSGSESAHALGSEEVSPRHQRIRPASQPPASLHIAQGAAYIPARMGDEDATPRPRPPPLPLPHRPAPRGEELLASPRINMQRGKVVLSSPISAPVPVTPETTLFPPSAQKGPAAQLQLELHQAQPSSTPYLHGESEDSENNSGYKKTPCPPPSNKGKGKAAVPMDNRESSSRSAGQETRVSPAEEQHALFRSLLEQMQDSITSQLVLRLDRQDERIEEILAESAKRRDEEARQWSPHHEAAAAAAPARPAEQPPPREYRRVVLQTPPQQIINTPGTRATETPYTGITQSPSPPTTLQPINRVRYKNWRAKDVGIFYPNAPSSMGVGDRVREKGTTYYRMVTAFAHRICMYARLRPTSLLREHLDSLLEGTAQKWWTDAVDEEDQLYYMQEPDGIKAWLKRLTEHFAPSPKEAEEHLDALTYSPADARAGKGVEEYMTSIRAACRAFNETTTEREIVYRVWKQLHPCLWKRVDRPDEHITMSSFRKLLLAKQTTWKDLPDKSHDGGASGVAQAVTGQTYPNNRGGLGQRWRYEAPA